MKHPGHPVSTSPGWYKDRGPTPIEGEFSKAASDLADRIEREHWFGDTEKHHRYRVDFLLKDARLIIELDGHDYHSTKEQLAKDASRQRYLIRAGYTVMRFTGSEIFKDVQACVREVKQLYTELMQRAPAKFRVMYVDYPFVHEQMSKALRFYRELHPNKVLIFQPLEKIILHAIQWLHEKSFITVFIFCPQDQQEDLKHLNATVMDYEKGEVRFTTIASELYSIDLGEHLENFAHLFDEFLMVADDPVYCAPIRAVLPVQMSERIVGNQAYKYLANGKLLRLGNDETSFVGTELVQVAWQDIWYPIGVALGLNKYEL